MRLGLRVIRFSPWNRRARRTTHLLAGAEAVTAARFVTGFRRFLGGPRPRNELFGFESWEEGETECVQDYAGWRISYILAPQSLSVDSNIRFVISELEGNMLYLCPRAFEALNHHEPESIGPFCATPKVQIAILAVSFSFQRLVRACRLYNVS